MKKSNLNLSLVLDAKQFHEGLDEICRHFDDSHSDDYLNGLVQNVADAKEALFGSMYIASVKRGVLEESRTLNARIAAATRYLDLCAYDNDAEVRASAKLLRRQLKAYGNALTLMRVDSRLTAVEALLRDLGGVDFQPHVNRLPELSGRLAEILTAKEELRRKRLLVDQLKSSMVKPEPLLKLKREAADQLAVLVAYLKVMATKDSATYAGHYAVVTEIITRLNARPKPRALFFDDELDDDFIDETTDDATDVTDGAISA